MSIDNSREATRARLDALHAERRASIRRLMWAAAIIVVVIVCALAYSVAVFEFD